MLVMRALILLEEIIIRITQVKTKVKAKKESLFFYINKRYSGLTLTY